MKNKISVKLWIITTILVLGIISITFIFQVFMLDENYTKAKIKEAIKTADEVINIIEEIGISDDAFEQITELTSVSKESVALLNDGGDSYFSSLFFSSRSFDNGDDSNDEYVLNSYEENEEEHKVPPPLAHTDLRNNLFEIFFDLVADYTKKNEEFILRGDKLQDKDIPFDIKTIAYGKPFEYEEDSYFVIVTSPLDPITEVTGLITNQLLIIAIVALIAGTLLAFLLSKSFTKKIVKIKDVSSEIAKGNFDKKVSFKSKDEFEDLANSINEMSYQLSQLEVFRREFISNTSHDLKTPLSSISVYAELIKDLDLNERDKLNKYSKIIMDEVKRLNSRVSEISELSKLEAGYYKLEREEINLKSFISEVFEEINVLSKKKKIIFNNRIPDDTFIKADKNQLHKAFMNILSNSVKYSNENGSIETFIENNGEKVKVIIRDNGCGIKENDLKYVWDRFYKVNKARNEDDYSSGLGMSIIKNIFLIHGFKYGIESKENEGTTIWFEYSLEE